MRHGERSSYRSSNVSCQSSAPGEENCETVTIPRNQKLTSLLQPRHQATEFPLETIEGATHFRHWSECDLFVFFPLLMINVIGGISPPYPGARS